MNKTIVALLVFPFTVACASGGSFMVPLENGSTARVTSVGYTGLSAKGIEYGTVEICDPDGNNCVLKAEQTVSNNSILEQVGGPAATVGAAKLLADGIEGSGDNINNSNSNNADARSMAASNSTSSSVSKSGVSMKGGGSCRGNCGGRRGW